MKKENKLLATLILGTLTAASLSANEAQATRYNDSINVNFENQDITGGSMEGGQGGAMIYESSGTHTIKTSSFSGNKAAEGGAIANTNGTLELSGTNTFSGNSASSHGEDIFNSATVEFSGTTNLNSSVSTNDANLYNTGMATVNTGAALNATSIINTGNSAKLTNNGTIQANVVNSGSGASLTNNATITGNVTNSGTLTSKADGISGTVTNTNGTYNITGGAITGAINSGTVNITGNTSVSDLTKLMSADSVTNKATLTVTHNNGAIGKAIANAADGTGRVTIDATNVSIGASIANYLTINNGKSATTSNAVNIGNSVTNNGTLTITGGNLGQTVANGTTGIVSVSGGSIQNNITGGTLTFTGNASNSSSGTSVTNLNVNNSSTTMTNTGTISVTGAVSNAGTIQNQGTLNLTGTSNTYALAGTVNKGTAATGTLAVGNNVTVNSTAAITQNSVTVGSGANLNINSGSLNAAVTNSGNLTAASAINGTVNNSTSGSKYTVKSGTIAAGNNVTGSGSTVIDGTVISNAQLNKVTINSGKQLTTNADNLKNTVTNSDGTLVLNGGTLANQVNGGTLNITGNVSSAAGNLKANTISNTSNLTLTGGTLTKAISGSGTTLIGGTVRAENTISNAVTISGSNALTVSTAANLGSAVSNASGTLNIEGGAIERAINGAGTTYIKGNVTAVTAAIANQVVIDSTRSLTIGNASLFDNVVNNNGTLTISGGTTDQVISTSGGSGELIISGNSTAGANITTGTLNVQNSEFTIANGKTVTVTNTLTNSGTIKGDGTLVVDGEITAAGAIQSAVQVKDSGDSLTMDLSNLQGSKAIENNGSMSLAGGASANVDNAHAITGNGSIAFTGKVNNTAKITQAAGISSSGTLISNAGNIDSALTNTGRYEVSSGDIGKAVTGSGTTYITGEGASLSASMGNAVTIQETGKLSTTNAGNFTKAVTNHGELTLKGGSLNKSISGNDGTTVIDDATTIVASGGQITQNQITVTNDGTLDVQTSANNILSEIANSGVVNFKNGGAITKNISNGTSNGTLNIKSNTNIGTSEDTTEVQVVQGTISVDNSAIVYNYGHVEGALKNNGTIYNDSANTLVIAPGGAAEDYINNGTITTSNNEGHLQIGTSAEPTVSYTNNGTITQATIDLYKNATLINNDTKKITVTTEFNNRTGATINNNGELHLQGTETGKMKNSGTIQNSSGTTGKTYVEGILDSTDGSILQNIDISGSGKLTINASNIGGTNSTVANAVANGLVLVGGDLERYVTGSGSTQILAGANTVTNKGSNQIQQAVNVETGTFVNAGTSTVSGKLTVGSNATATNSSTSTSALGTVENNGIFNVSAGTVGSVTNNATAVGKGVSQTGGTVTSATNKGNYSISKGTLTSVSNTANASKLEISGSLSETSVGSVTNTNGTTTQSGGTVADATNAATYNISAGKISGNISNTGTLGVSGTADVNDITNNASGTKGVTQSGGTVATVSNGTTAAGKYTITDGTISTSITNNYTGSLLDIQGTSTNGITLVTNTIGSVTQSGGKVVDATNAGTYTISGGSISNEIENQTTGNLTIQGTTTGTTIKKVTNKASGTYGVTQEGGAVTTVDNGTTGASGVAGKYALSSGTVGTLNNYKGTVTQTGDSVVTNAVNQAVYNLQTGEEDSITNYTQTTDGAVTNISNNSTLVVGTGSSITTGTINIGSSTTGTGSLKINAGSHSAKVVTTGASAFNIENGTFTTQGETNIADAAEVAVAASKTLNHASGEITLGSNDDWDGIINVSSGGTLKLNGVTQDGTLSQTSGGKTEVIADQTLGTNTTINSGEFKTTTGTTTFTGGTLTSGDGNAKVTIGTGTTLDITGGSVTLDGGSGTHGQVNWVGDVQLNGGSLILANIYDTSRETTETKNKTGTLTANTGNLTINASNVLLGNNDVIESAVVLTLLKDITVADSAKVTIGGTGAGADTWTTGNITQTGGQLFLDTIQTASTKKVLSSGGILNVLNTVTLADADSIGTGTTLKIEEENSAELVLNSTSATAKPNVTVDSGDTWTGKISQTGYGTLTLKDRKGAKADTTDGDKTYNMTSANAILNLDNSILKLATAASKTTAGTVNINNGSTLTYDNGAADNAAAIVSGSATASNSLVIGGDNTTTLTLSAGSDVKANTPTTVHDNGTLNSYGTMIKGTVANDGIYNLRNDGTTAGSVVAAITGDGTLNLINATENSGSGTISQAIINVMHESPAASGTFTAGAAVTAHTDANDGELNIKSANDSIINAIANNLITADKLNNDGKIDGDGGVYGNLTVNNGGYSKNGSIDQAVINFVAGTFDNDVALTAHKELINSAEIDNSSTVTAEVLTNTGVISGDTGALLVKNGGSSSGDTASITQDTIEFEAGTFTNSAPMTAVTSLTIDEDATLINNNNTTINAPTYTNNGTLRNVGTGSTTETKAQITGTASVFTNNGLIENTGDISAKLVNTDGAIIRNTNYGTLARVDTNEIGGKIYSTASGLTDTVTNDGDVYLNYGNTRQGALTVAINSTDTTNVGNLYIERNSEIDVVTNDAGTSTGSIIQKYIEVQENAKLTNWQDGSIKAATMWVNQGTLELREGSTTDVPQITIDKGTLALVDDAELKAGSNVLLNDGTLKLIADTKNVEFRAPVDEDSTYSISAESKPGLKVTIDSDISKASSITTEKNSTLDLDSVTIGTLGDKTVTMENGSTLGLNGHNTHDSTYVDVTFESNIKGNNYALNINNDGSNSKVTLQTDVVGAKEINVINGVLEMNDLTEDLDGNPIKKANIHSAPINLKVDEDNDYEGDMNLIAQKQIDWTSNIKGDDVSKNDLYIRDAEGETKNGVVKLFSTIDNVAVHVDSGELWLTSPSTITSKSTVDVASNAILNVINDKVDKYGKNYTLADNSKLKFDADTVAFKTDNFAKANKEGKVVVDLVNPLNADKIVHDNSIIDLRQALGIQNLEYSKQALNQYFLELTPVRYLQGRIDKESNTLMFFKTGDEYENFNPAVMNSAIAAQIGGYLTQLDTYNQAFGNMDMYSMMTQEERQAAKFANKYAAADSNLVFSPLSNPNPETSAWFRPYTTFEHVKMKRGPKVKNIGYGTFAGLESGLFDLGRGWDANFGVYAGYNGSHQSYPGFSGVIQRFPGLRDGQYTKFPANSMYQNGATVGLVGMAFKNDFFLGTTVNVSDNIVDATNMYGKEDFNMLMSGAAVKTGYNWDLAKGKFIIQPSFQTSYSFVNTFNYTNSAGVRVHSDPLNAIQIEPQLKLIGNFKHGWQPYAHLSGVWTMMDKSKYMANDVSLPELSIKPFAKYGFGLRKTFGDRASGFFQTFFTSGGRNGMGLQFGFKIQLGDSQKKQTKKIKAKTKNEKQISDKQAVKGQKKYITKKAKKA